MRGASFLLGVFVLGVASAAACAEGDSPGFENVGGGGGASGDGGSGEGGDDDDDDDDDTSGSRASASTGPTSTSAVTSVSSTGSATTTSATTSTTSTGAGGAPCTDTGLGEPGNDTMDSAYNLGEQPSDDGEERTIAGVLLTPDDVDWYFYLGTDDVDGTVDPGRQIIGAGVRICKYVECVEGDAEFECPSGTQADTQGGRAGCCWTDNEPLEWGLNCTGVISDDARIYMRVDNVGGPGCESYSLKFNY